MNIERGTEFRSRVALPTAFIFSVILALWGWQIYPLATGDSIDILPPAMEIARGHTLTNPLSMVAGMLDPTGQRRFIYYPPLFQLVLGHAMPSPDPRWMFLLIALMNSASLLIFASFMAKTRLPNGVMVLLLLATVTTFTYHRSGRPETLATLLLMMGWCAHVYQSGIRRLLCLGFLMGAMAATHVVGYIFCVPLLFAVESLREKALITVRNVVMVGILSAISFFVLMQWSPHSTAETLRAIYKHATIAVFPTNPHRFKDYYLFHVLSPFLAGVCLASVISSVTLLWRRTAAFPFGAWAGLLGFFFTSYYFGVRSVNRNYNVLLFSPLLFGVLAYCWDEKVGGKGARWLLVGILAVAGTGFLRCTALYPMFLSKGVSLVEGRQRVGALLAMSPRTKLGVTSGLWVLSEEYERMYQWEPGVPKTNLYPGQSLRLLQQNYYNMADRPSIEDYQLGADYFIPGGSIVIGLMVQRTIPGYAFAVYQPFGSSL